MLRVRLARVGGELGWRGAVAGAVLAAAVAGAGALPATAATTAPARIGAVAGTAAAARGPAKPPPVKPPAVKRSSACGKAVGPFSVSGTQVLGAAGQPFVSYGLTVPGLQSPDWASSTVQDLQEIAAAANNWCANTVRLQLNQDDLLGPNGTGFDQAYMSAIQAEVSLAETYHLVVVLNDETNLATPAEQAVQMGPTPGTETFWQDLTKPYGNDPQVIFDLFNEPRMYSAGMSLAKEWQLWRDGGSFEGVSYPFGMAQLAAYVRTTLGAHNLFWIEGPRYSSTFAGMVQQHALLNVSHVVYALHHPVGPADAASWDADFGYLITAGVAPVVDGEWTNYEPAPTSYPTAPRGSCWPDAPTSVPEFLQYLAAHAIGLNAYTLQPGFLIKSYGNLADPTTMNVKTWSCQSDSEPEPGQGAGAEVLAWFQQQNG
jgi:Cellulase (glycosyl hydrolase family 5)